MHERLKIHLQRALDASANASTRSGRTRPAAASPLLDAATQLLARVKKIIRLELPAARIDLDALETACFALQLPFRTNGAIDPATAGLSTSMGVISVTDRCQHAAELLVGIASDDLPEALIDRTTRVLVECPRKQTTQDEARALSDALNLEDFGISGLCRSAAMLVQIGGGLTRLADALAKRDAYGYWDARLKDGFHFESTRTLARARLARVRDAAQHLTDELREDEGG